jgi:DNA-binding NarL/FixJ family response regulator
MNAIRGSDGHLIAREAELGRVMSIFESVATGPGRVVLLDGEPGIGKTRLAREVLACAQRTGALTLVGRCFEQHEAAPFFPFMELLGSAFDAVPANVQSGARQRWPELVHLIPNMAQDEPEKVTAEYTQLRLFRATSSFISEQAEVKPLVMLLDDLHWADSTSLSLLLFLARYLATAHVLIVGTYRDTEVGRRQPLESILGELVRERLVDEVHLRRMSAAGTSALVSARLGAASDDLISFVHSRAQGNPFFTEELLAALVEQGVLSGDARQAVKSLGELELPRSVRSLIGERISRLPRRSHELLRLASLLGEEFELDVLLAVSDLTEDEVLDALDAALEAHVIEHPPSDQERFAFAHALIQQTLSEELPIHRRRRLHIKIGDALAHARSRPSASAALARHFLLGGDTERGVEYAIRAGDDAAARYAHAEAAHHYRVALDLLLEPAADSARAAEVSYRLAGELYDLNKLPEALAAFEAAFVSYGRLNNQGGQALAQWGIARLHQGRYDMATADRHAAEALRFWPHDQEDGALVHLLVDAARIKAFGGFSGGADLADRALAVAEQLGDAGLIARALFGVQTTRATARHNPADLVRILDRAADSASRGADWRTLSRVCIGRAVERWMLGDLEGSISDWRLAIAAAERSGELERVIFAHIALGGGLLRTGAWEEAHEALNRALGLNTEGLELYAFYLPLVAWLDGRRDDALRDLATNADVSRRRRDVQGLTVCLNDQADYALQLGRVDAAEAPAREAFAVSQAKFWTMVGFSAGPLAETLAWLGTDDAAQVLAEVEEIIDGCGLAIARPQLLRARARLLARNGATAAALDALEASATLARSQHAEIELARSLALMASIARPDAESLAARADGERLEIVRRLGPAARGLVWAHGLPQRARVRASDETGGPLSPREREVTVLIVGGLSNRQIAESLVISERTVENHVSSILAKLGLDTRGQVGVWAVQHGISAQSE